MELIKTIIIKLLKFFKIFEKNRKLNFEIVFRLRCIYLFFYNLLVFEKKLTNFMIISGSDKGIKNKKIYYGFKS